MNDEQDSADAFKDRKWPKDRISKHQNGDSRWKTAEAGCGDRAIKGWEK